MSEATTIQQEADGFWAKHFCVCGDSDKALDAFREIMGLFSDITDYGSHMVDDDARDAYALKHGLGLTHCVLYWLDGMGLTEHGTSVNYSWLTPLGEHVKKEIMDGTPEFFREEE